MTIPTNQLVWAGVWNVATTYPQYQFVQSSVDGLCYVNVNIQPSIGGADPSVQPSLFWVLLNNPPLPSGISDINGLTDAFINLTSSDTTVTITPAAPSTIDLSTAYSFPPQFGWLSSNAIQPLNPTYPILTPLNVSYSAFSGLGVTHPTSTEIKINTTGFYKLLSSIQIDKFTAGTGAIYMYPMVNGVAVQDSATKLVVNQNLEDIMTIEWFLNLSEDDLVSIQCYSPDSGIRLLAISASAPVPAVPSIILNILRIA